MCEGEGEEGGWGSCGPTAPRPASQAGVWELGCACCQSQPVEPGTHWSADRLTPCSPRAPSDCVLPGQACSYKVGQLSILKLRAVLQAQLGAAFDVRAFHRCLLEGGGIPVAMLAQVTASLLAGAEPQPQPAAKA